MTERHTPGEAEPDAPAIDPKWYRQVLGQYPTGVCVVTGQTPEGEPVAMVVGSFTSVSLNPPLVAFFPDRNSSSWAKLRNCENFCVNILGADQEPVCRKLASKDPDKFSGTPHRLSSCGSPVVDGVVAWIECERYSVTDAGDHEMVTGLVREMDVVGGGLPLLFFQGGYGRFTPASMAAEEGQGLTLAQLRDVDRARSEMEGLASSISARCIATVRGGDELVIAASAGQTRRGSAATLVGQRLPFVPPTGSILAAWLPTADADRWLDRQPPEKRAVSAAALAIVRERGFSVGLINDAQRAFSQRLSAAAEGGHHIDLEDLFDGLSYDPADLTKEMYREVRIISAPVFDREGRVTLALSLHDFPKPSGEDGVAAYIKQLVAAAAIVTKRLGGKSPAT
jgi:flavin reductase (DIM6/NTAB) family NADH-FMN oxidoreductase RutF